MVVNVAVDERIFAAFDDFQGLGLDVAPFGFIALGGEEFGAVLIDNVGEVCIAVIEVRCTDRKSVV